MTFFKSEINDLGTVYYVYSFLYVCFLANMNFSEFSVLKFILRGTTLERLQQPDKNWDIPGFQSVYQLGEAGHSNLAWLDLRMPSALFYLVGDIFNIPQPASFYGKFPFRNISKNE